MGLDPQESGYEITKGDIEKEVFKLLVVSNYLDVDHI